MHLGHFYFTFRVKDYLFLTVNISISNDTTLAPEDLPTISSTDMVSDLIFETTCVLYTLIIIFITWCLLPFSNLSVNTTLIINDCGGTERNTFLALVSFFFFFFNSSEYLPLQHAFWTFLGIYYIRSLSPWDISQGKVRTVEKWEHGILSVSRMIKNSSDYLMVLCSPH